MEEVVGILTVLVSIVGATLALKHYFFYKRSPKGLARKMRRVFFTDGLIYIITLYFGVWAYFDLSHDVAIIGHWIRVPILLVNIYASYRLYNHYRLL